VKWYGKYGRKAMIGKIWKKGKLNSEKIWKICRNPSWIVKKYGKDGRKVSWIVKRYEHYGRKASRIVIRYEQYGRKASWIMKWYGKYGRKVSWKVKRYEKCGRKVSWTVKRYGNYWKSTGKKYGKMRCFITSCTRKASNVAFQTLRFEKVRVKSTGKLNVL
jgi:hypothetical protein